jgi:hypothetical protein
VDVPIKRLRGFAVLGFIGRSMPSTASVSCDTVAFRVIALIKSRLPSSTGKYQISIDISGLQFVTLSRSKD